MKKNADLIKAMEALLFIYNLELDLKDTDKWVWKDIKKGIEVFANSIFAPINNKKCNYAIEKQRLYIGPLQLTVGIKEIMNLYLLLGCLKQEVHLDLIHFTILQLRSETSVNRDNNYLEYYAGKSDTQIFYEIFTQDILSLIKKNDEKTQKLVDQLFSCINDYAGNLKRIKSILKIMFKHHNIPKEKSDYIVHRFLEIIEYLKNRKNETSILNEMHSTSFNSLKNKENINKNCGYAQLTTQAYTHMSVGFKSEFAITISKFWADDNYGDFVRNLSEDQKKRWDDRWVRYLKDENEQNEEHTDENKKTEEHSVVSSLNPFLVVDKNKQNEEHSLVSTENLSSVMDHKKQNKKRTAVKKKNETHTNAGLPSNDIPTLSYDSWVSFQKVLVSFFLEYCFASDQFKNIKLCENEKCRKMILENRRNRRQFCSTTCRQAYFKKNPRNKCRDNQNKWIEEQFNLKNNEILINSNNKQLRLYAGKKILIDDCAECKEIVSRGYCPKIIIKNPILIDIKPKRRKKIIAKLKWAWIFCVSKVQNS